MNLGKLGLALAVSMIVFALPLALLGALPQGYGVTLLIEGEPFEIDGQLLCRDLAGIVVVSFGGEFHSMDLCGLLRRGERRALRAGFGGEIGVRIDFDEGVRDWLRRLEWLGVRRGMSAGEVEKSLEEKGLGVVTMPSVSVTLWLVGDGAHYIASYVYTSFHYYASRGHDYFSARRRVLEDPLAVVRGHPPIVIRLGDLAGRLVPVDLTRALEAARRELGLEDPEPERAAPTPSTCPPGYHYYETGVCYRENYWGLPEASQEWFAKRVWVHSSLDRDMVIQDMWTRFLNTFTTAYLLDKSRFQTAGDAWAYLTAAPNPCRGGAGVPTDMGYVVRECLRPDHVPGGYVDWEHSVTRGALFTVYKPLVISVVSHAGDMPPMRIRLTYMRAEQRFGFSLTGALLWSEEGYSVGPTISRLTFHRDYWNNLGIRHIALIVPTNMTYEYDAIVFTWNVRTYSYGGREYWLAEPVPIVAPYYREVGQAPALDGYRWGFRYDTEGNCWHGCPPHAWNINDLVDRLTETIPTEHYLLREAGDVRLFRSETLDRLPIEFEANGSRYVESLGAVLSGIPRDLLLGLFSGHAPPPFDKLLGLLECAETTFRSGTSLRFEWEDLRNREVRVAMFKVTKVEEYLSPAYRALGNRPLVARYVVVIGEPRESGEEGR